MRSTTLLAAAVGVATLMVGVSPALADAPTPQGTSPISLTPYSGDYVDLYATPDGPIMGATYIFNPVANFRDRMAFDFANMKDDANINTVGFYNLVQMTDSDRDALFADLEHNHQKAAVRIEHYDGSTFDFDHNDAANTDAHSVLDYYNTDDAAHGYTALLDYLKANNLLKDIAYFAVNMPVDDGSVANHFQSAQYPDGRDNPEWASSQSGYAEEILTLLRSALGDAGAAQLYLSVFYGWDLGYETPSYAQIDHPADGYFFNNYSYPATTPPDETDSAANRLNQPRLQRAMDRLMAQYPTQPKVIEYGFHTVEYNRGGIPGQTAGLVASLAAKRLALKETTAYYGTGSTNGQAFNVRGSLYFAQNLYKEEGNPPSIDDWTLNYPNTARVEAEDASSVQNYQGADVVGEISAPDRGASGGRSVNLDTPGRAIEFINMGAASVVQIRYRARRAATVSLSVNGAAATEIRLPRSIEWTTTTLNTVVPLQGSVKLVAEAPSAGVAIDWLQIQANYEAETGTRTTGVTFDDAAASQGSGVTLRTRGESLDYLDGVAAGTHLALRYCARQPTSIEVSIGEHAPIVVDLPATADAFVEHLIDVPVPAAAHIRVVARTDRAPLRLDYVQVLGQYEAESSGGLYNGAHAVANHRATGGAYATDFDVVGASVVFSEIGPGTQLKFHYAAVRDAQMTVYAAGTTTTLNLPSTGSAQRFRDAAIEISIPAATTVVVQRNVGDQAIGLYLDHLRVS